MYTYILALHFNVMNLMMTNHKYKEKKRKKKKKKKVDH